MTGLVLLIVGNIEFEVCCYAIGIHLRAGSGAGIRGFYNEEFPWFSLQVHVIQKSERAGGEGHLVGNLYQGNMDMERTFMGSPLLRLPLIGLQRWKT